MSHHNGELEPDDPPAPEPSEAEIIYDISERELDAESLALLESFAPPPSAIEALSAKGHRWRFEALWNAAPSAPAQQSRKRVPKGQSGAIWRMRDGRTIRICDMDDRHLLNTIAMLKKASEAKRLSEVMCLGRYAEAHAGSHAADAIDNEVDRIICRDDPADYFEIYPALIRTAQARGLEAEYSALTIYKEQSK
jgi:hypothetical protein